MPLDEPAPDQSAPAWTLSRGQPSCTVVRSVGFDCPGGSAAAGVARHRVLDELGEMLQAEDRDNLVLLISELVTNCVRHAGMTRATDLIGVQAGLTEDLIRIEVSDTGPGFSPSAPRVGNLKDGSGGLGLVLLDRLALSWGVAKGNVFCVWAEFERNADAAAT